MLKKTLKKAAAVICAAAVCAQLAVMPTVSAKYIKEDHSPVYLAAEEYDEIIENYTTESKQVDKQFLFPSNKSGSFRFSFDFKLEGKAPAGSDKKGEINTCYLQLQSKENNGSLFLVKTCDGSTYTLMWKTSRVDATTTPLNCGEKYTMLWDFANVADTGASVVITIQNAAGDAVYTSDKLGLRGITEKKESITGIKAGAWSEDGTNTGWTIDNFKYIDGIDSIVVKLNDAEPAENASYTLEQYDDTSYDVKASAMLGTAEVVKELQIKATGKGASYANGKLTFSKDLPSGTYDVVITSALSENPDISVSYPVKFVKADYTDDDYLKEMKGRLKLKNADGEEIADADMSNITTDLMLDQGDSKISITWDAGREVSVEVPVLDSNGKPTVDSNGKPVTKTEIQWQRDTSVINPSTGVITPDEEDKAITLRATLAMKDEASDAEPQISNFDITVKGVKDTVQKAVDAIKFISNDDAAKEVDLTKLSEDVKLQTTSNASSYITIKWDTDNSENLKLESNTGKIFLAKPGTAKANLTATVSYIKSGKTSSTITKTYPVTVSIDSTSNGKYTVRCDAASSENFSGIPESGDTVTDDIDLPTKGIFGSDIAWSSSSPSAISNIGKVTRQSSSKTVTLTATIKKDGTTQSVKFSGIKVAAKNSSTSGSSGGSSSGSEKKTYIAPNTVTPAPIVNNNNNNQQNQNPNTNKGFTDLGSVEWAQPAINSMYARGILAGKSATEFAPNDNVTRAEFAKIVVKAFGLEDSGAAVSTFSDVNAGDWYYEYVAAAYNKGIITGYNDGRFGVADNITRQDMAVIIYRAAQAAGKSIKDVNAAINFADAGSIADYAKEAVTALQKGGVINGVSATEFAPAATATRAQAAKMVYGLI